MRVCKAVSFDKHPVHMCTGMGIYWMSDAKRDATAAPQLQSHWQLLSSIGGPSRKTIRNRMIDRKRREWMRANYENGLLPRRLKNYILANNAPCVCRTVDAFRLSLNFARVCSSSLLYAGITAFHGSSKFNTTFSCGALGHRHLIDMPLMYRHLVE